MNLISLLVASLLNREWTRWKRRVVGCQVCVCEPTSSLGGGFGVGAPHGHGRKQENTFLCFPEAKAQQEKNCNQSHASF